MSGLFAFRRRAVDLDRLNPVGFKILLEILVRGKVQSVSEIPFTFGPRRAGASKASLKVGLDYFALLYKLWRSRS